MRVATLDIGTNSVLLLIAEQSPSAPQHALALCERCTITRLGKGVDQSRRLEPEAVERTLACLRDYAALMEEHGVQRRAAVATSAVRDATGAEDFLRQAASILGTAPRVIDGATEAQMTFAGALAGLEVSGPIAVFDIGGGSTEIVYGFVGPNGRPVYERGVSLDIGAVRMTERHVRTDPPSAAELEEMRADVRTWLRTAPPPGPDLRWVGIAGTVTTVSAMELGLETYDGKRVHGHTLPADRIAHWVRELARVPLAVRKQTPGLEPARADVIVAGALIAEELLRWAGAAQVTISDRGVRWGLAAELFSSR